MEFSDGLTSVTPLSHINQHVELFSQQDFEICTILLYNGHLDFDRKLVDDDGFSAADIFTHT